MGWSTCCPLANVLAKEAAWMGADTAMIRYRRRCHVLRRLPLAHAPDLEAQEECDVFSSELLTEIVRGFLKCNPAQQYELIRFYWYSIAAKLADIVDMLRGRSAGDVEFYDRCAVTLRAMATQADERVGYLIQVAASGTGDTGFSRAYWQTLARHQFDDRRVTGLRGPLADAHNETQRALRNARAKATANAELARNRRNNGKDSKPP